MTLWVSFGTMPLYSPLHPSSLTSRSMLCMMPFRGPSLPAICILLFTVIYGYVMLVASSLLMAPRKKVSRGVSLLRCSSISLSCSNMVYCNIGFTTKNRAGDTPAKRATGPSILKSVIKVAKLEGFRAGLSDFVEDLGSSEEDSSAWRAAILVLTTHIGLVIRTVALPATAPASIDSIVVSFLDARDVRTAARWKKARVDSYPGQIFVS